MLEKLTPQQEKLLSVVKDYWINKLYKGERLNKESAIKQVNWFYDFCKISDKSPNIIFVSSPLAAQYMINVICNSIDKRDQVENQVRNQVGNQVGNQVRNQIENQVENQVENQKLGYFSFTRYGSIWDYGWVSFYDFFRQIGIINSKQFDNFIDLLNCSIYDMILTKDFCVVCEMPEKISVNENYRLHNETYSAIKWADGYELYFWKGISVPERWVTQKDKITKDDFMNEKNAEKRRCLTEIIGNKRLVELLDIITIDEDNDNYGYPMRLLRTKEKDDTINDYIYWLSVICNSTQREYLICVPECKNVWEAKVWTFDNQKIQIRHGDVGLLNLAKEFNQPVFES
jgi:hypothetical protein